MQCQLAKLLRISHRCNIPLQKLPKSSTKLREFTGQVKYRRTRHARSPVYLEIIKTTTAIFNSASTEKDFKMH